MSRFQLLPDAQRGLIADLNGMTDGYDENGAALVAFDGDELPREVRFSCDGINSHRSCIAAGYRSVQQLISTDSDRKDLVIFTPEREPIPG